VGKATSESSYFAKSSPSHRCSSDSGWADARVELLPTDPAEDGDGEEAFLPSWE
jgi:hypothetical protein